MPGLQREIIMLSKGREKIVKTINIYGTCILEIVTPDDIRNNTAGHPLTIDGEPIEEKEITKNVLHMIAEAYFAGYEEATIDAGHAVSRLLLENNRKKKPLPKITETIDFRTKFPEEVKEKLKKYYKTRG